MENQSNQGIFITFEGGEASGKSTQAKKLYNHLLNLSRKVILTREPGGSDLGEQIRELFLNYNMDSTSQLFLNMASRREHLNNLILPNLDTGGIVICDRYIDSTACYQGLCGSIDSEEIYKLHNKWLGKMPDLTFLLDVDWQEASTRMKQRKANNKWDQQSASKHEEIYSGFRKLANNFAGRIKLIDSRQSQEQVFLQILSELEVKFNTNY